MLMYENVNLLYWALATWSVVGLLILPRMRAVATTRAGAFFNFILFGPIWWVVVVAGIAFGFSPNRPGEGAAQARTGVAAEIEAEMEASAQSLNAELSRQSKELAAAVNLVNGIEEKVDAEIKRLRQTLRYIAENMEPLEADGAFMWTGKKEFFVMVCDTLGREREGDDSYERDHLAPWN